MTEMLRIQVSTLNEIIDALNVSEYVTVRIQLSPLNDEENIIARKTLEKVADEVRAFDGTTGKILIGHLAKRILELSESPDIPDIPVTVKLATPIIALYDDDGIIEPDTPNTEYNTTAILGKAILGLAILGNAIDDGATLVKLATPVIYLEEVTEDSGEDEPVDPAIIQLSTPIIYLEEIADDVQLATPVIYIDEIRDDIKLGTPIIYFQELRDDVQLATPVIYLYEETEKSIQVGKKYRVAAPNGVVGLSGLFTLNGTNSSFDYGDITVDEIFVFESSISISKANTSDGVRATAVLKTSIGDFVLGSVYAANALVNITKMTIINVSTVTLIE